MEVASILAQHPEWDRGPCRLHVPAAGNATGDVNRAIDHISPRSWKGDVTVKNVLLRTCWAMGRNKAETMLAEAGIKVDFDALEEKANINILSPLGKPVGSDGLLDGEIDEVDMVL
ncbi:hypothetical protein M422DRAFT_52525 [Sphaerobolus stellatus SS14]|uniref:Uncharacterized protein n=1 Tax=Sphaerobolus stellatus (strain SS14) TaxID=990650 RepID=A0A0C9V6V7_SPHS4|nr:hypothetical protein M422DRAFT_52525 [Sphaerobolus stellatus SS14]